MARLIDTDVLVIGSGTAGCRTALTAHKLGVKVLLMEKALFARSGASRVARRFGVPTNEDWAAKLGFPTDQTLGQPFILRRMKDLGGRPGLDPELAKMLLAQLVGDDIFAPSADFWQYMLELEDMGALFFRYPDGKIHPEPQTGVHSAGKTDVGGKMVLETLSAEIRRRNITVMENTMALRYLTRDNTVVGIIALDVITGQLVAVRAKAVVSCMGSVNLFSVNTPPDTCTGDGYAMALRAGVELMDIHQQGYYNYKNPWKGPFEWRWSCAVFWAEWPIVKEGPVFFNTLGENIQEKYTQWYKNSPKYGDYISIPQPLLITAIAKEIREGRGTENGGIFVSYKHVPNIKENMKKDWWRYPYLEKLGIDPSKDMWEVTVVPHMVASWPWARTSIKAETNLEGLFAAGGALTGCMRTGKWAGTSAAERAKNIEMPEIDRSQIEEEEKRIADILTKRPAKGAFPPKVKQIIRKLMWEKCGFWKNAKDLADCVKELRRIREEVIPKMGVETDSRQYNRALIEYIETINLLDIAEVYTSMCLLTEESFPPFMRDDFPDEYDMQKSAFVKFVDGKLKYSQQMRNQKAVDVELPL